MKLSIKNEDKTKMDFLLKSTSVSFANLLRRFVMSRVPVFAIDSVTFYENSSPLFDEYIAHRIGMVPLKLGTGVRDEEEVLFSLDASGPGTVHSSALKSRMDKIKVATEKIPLLKLLEGQNLRLEAKAISGIGRDHAKYQAGLASYNILEGGNDFEFEIESFMQISPRDMALKSADAISQRCTELAKGLNEIKKEAKKK
ncbi:DNA-directed RNA polymerase subunit D [Candidatus Micrarchaeota archaeon CG10_big_fil_rev_8_21_14_0_10_45_29]|nr:MAG: DNA-directed RNA polymerase subunit D [Candidatus Micrarchaeota archaeon CG10_big_fil_rev_8_21_14_0_10_45_29]